MKTTFWCATATALAMVANPARAANWSLGSNLGLSLYGGDSSGMSAPYRSGGKLEGVAGGLRLGIAPGNGQHEIYLDSGFGRLSGGGHVSRSSIFALNYQLNAPAPAATRPYATFGVGFVSLAERSAVSGSSVTSVGSTSMIIGGGVGLRHAVAQGHGGLRGEMRLDYLTEGSGSTGYGSGYVISLKLGFDLWMK